MRDDDRIRWARALAFSASMFVAAYLGFMTWQIRRAFAISSGSFEDGIWWQRIEQISFLSLPQNLMVLVPAACAAVGGTILVRSLVDPTVVLLAQLVRIVAGICAVVVIIAALGIVGIFFRNPDNVGDLAAFLLRLGGIAMCSAMIRVCLESERSV